MYHTYSMVFYTGANRVYTAVCGNQSPRLNLMVFVVSIKTQSRMQCIYVCDCYSLHSAPLHTGCVYTLSSIQKALLLAHLPSTSSNMCFDIILAGQADEHRTFSNTMHTRHTYLLHSTPIAAEPVWNTYIHIYMRALHTIQSICSLHRFESEEKVRAENNMQEHKIIVVVKSFVHNREWQRNYQV